VQRFGYETSEIHGRFIKGKLAVLSGFKRYVFDQCAGDLRSNEFVGGGRDGRIRLWDMRSCRGPFATVSRAPENKIRLIVHDIDQPIDGLFHSNKGCPSGL
jgi:hypothetical protein